MCVLFQAKKLSNIFFRFQLQSVAKYEKEFCKTSFKCSAHPLLAKSISYFCPSLKTPLASIIIKHTSHQWKLFFVRKCKARQLPFESLPQNVKAYLGKKNLQWSWKSWKWPAIINVCRWKIVQLFRKKIEVYVFTSHLRHGHREANVLLFLLLGPFTPKFSSHL